MSSEWPKRDHSFRNGFLTGLAVGLAVCLALAILFPPKIYYPPEVEGVDRAPTAPGEPGAPAAPDLGDAGDPSVGGLTRAAPERAAPPEAALSQFPKPAAPDVFEGGPAGSPSLFPPDQP